ncbi:MAG: endopeptidase La [Candidatus Desulfofervidus auxilii]|nr:endopeptidase La [Candidatus Desulfofervidus auxilii]
MQDFLEEKEIVVGELLPVIPMKDLVVFPSMILPIFIGRPISLKAVEESLVKDKLILLITQKEPTIENPTPQDLYEVGTIALIMRQLRLPDGRLKLLIQGLTKARVKEYIQISPFLLAKIKVLEDKKVSEITVEIEALMRNVKEQSEKILSLKGLDYEDIFAIISQIDDPGQLADIIASNLRFKVSEAQKILEILEPVERLRKVNELLGKELQVSKVQAEIQSEAREEMDRVQREYFLREQLKAIKKELGEYDEFDEEIEEFREKIEKAKMPKIVKEEAFKQLERLSMMHPDSADANVIRTYLDWLVELPWRKSTKDKLDIKEAKKILDEDHYNLKKVKERILEYLSVRKLNPHAKGAILCFVGPPGVGKTSLGKSIARALGRKFVRISLGGIRDEAEIRGHRRTYIGAMPGRIIQGLKQVGSNNPVFMLDEIDKIGTDFRGDPASALLEVLDPEQNTNFSDHYLSVPFDLSKVMFITTANLIDPIPSALKDRMEIIEIPGYSEEEKLQIALKYLLPKQLKEHGLNQKDLKISSETIKKIISNYTREAGVRNLEREIGAICRKIARKLAEGQKGPFKVTPSNLHQYLGPPKYLPEIEVEESEVGVATGLAWTPYGGEILRVEVTVLKGKGNLMLTGQMGEVMQESAKAALSYVRSRAKALGLAEDFYEKIDVHIHVPEGAVPKDGPSAGITMAVALISALINKPVNKEIAMTGEITLRGRVLPVGGIKEKALAAARAKVKYIILPERNKKDLIEVPSSVKRQLKFIFVKNMDEVIEPALNIRLKNGNYLF